MGYKKLRLRNQFQLLNFGGSKMKFLTSAFLLIFVVTQSQQSKVRYRDFKVVTLKIENDEQMKVLQDLERSCGVMKKLF